MMRKNGCLNKHSSLFDCRRSVKIRYLALSPILLVFFLFGAFCASNKKVVVPQYSEFISSRTKVAPNSVVEIYGNYRAAMSGKKVNSSYNLLLEPGRRAYIEIVDPSKQLLYSISIDEKQISLLWAKQKEYIVETATPENLNRILGIPLLPDDLLQLISGNGIQFDKWQMTDQKEDGWLVERSNFRAELTLEENLCRVQFSSAGVPSLLAQYDRYEMRNNQSLPGRIRFKVPASKIDIELSVDRYEPRTGPATADLFALQIPNQAKQLTLKEIYNGKPIILQ